MSDTSEMHAESNAHSGAVNGLACAFALLIDVLETNGSLKPNQFEGVLDQVLRQPGIETDDPDVVVLEHVLSLLRTPLRPPLTVIAGGKS